MLRTLAVAVTAALVLTAFPDAQRPDTSKPSSSLSAVAQSRVDATKFETIETLIRQDIEQKKLPGAVVLVGRGDRILYQKAIGQRALRPTAEPMTLDTIFDLASLTKVVATTTGVMMLLEEGKVRLNDRVSAYVTGFERYGKGDITIRHLLTHMSGLRPDVDLADPWTGYDTAIALAIEEVPQAPPGDAFRLQRHQLLPARRHHPARVRNAARSVREGAHLRPLGMKDTMFTPPALLTSRIAPTEPCTEYGWPCEGPDMKMLRGTVHDPTARRMGGVAGHAGLFRTAADLSIFARMLLGGGAYRGVRILSPLAVAKMTTPATPAEERNAAVARLGHRFVVLVEPRRAAAARLVRPYGLHRHVALGRSGDRSLRRLPVEPRSPGRQGRRHAAPRPRRDRRGVGAHVTGAAGTSAPVDRARFRRRGGPAGAASARTGSHGDRRVARERVCARSKASASASSRTTRAARAMARPRSTCCTGRRT